jgi:hypothetical protein
MRAIDQLKAAVAMTPSRRAVELPNGSEFIYYAPPITLAQRAKAQKLAGGDDSTAFALQLLVMIATDENGTKLFTPADVAELKNSLPANLVETVMLQLLTWEASEVNEALDMKSDQAAAETGPPAVCVVRGSVGVEADAA